MKRSIGMMMLVFLAACGTVQGAESAAKASDDDALQCQAVAEKAAVKADTRIFGAEANSCGSKLLHAGRYLETYLVCASDETDPSEWIVVVRKYESKNGHVTGRCVVKHVDYTYDDETPDFEDR